MSKNTIVRGMLVPSLKNKPLDGRMDVPTLADIVNIENPYVNFIFPVAETGMWYKVTKLADKVIDELVIPNGEIAEYETFGEGMTDKQKEEYLTKSLAEQLYLKKSDAVLEYMSKTDAEANFLKNVQADLEYLKKSDAKILYQPTGDYVTSEEADQTYQPKGDYAMQQKVEELEQLITGGGGDGGTGGTFVDAPRDGKTYGRKDGLWEELEDAPSDNKIYGRKNNTWVAIDGTEDDGGNDEPVIPEEPVLPDLPEGGYVRINVVSDLAQFKDDLKGVVITVENLSTEMIESELIWDGSVIIYKGVAGASYRMSASAEKGFIAPDAKEFVCTYEGVDVEFNYKCDYLEIELASDVEDFKEGINVASVTITDIQTNEVVFNGTWNGNNLFAKVVNGDSYRVDFGEVEGYNIPQSYEFTAVGGANNYSTVYPYKNTLIVKLTCDTSDWDYELHGALVTIVNTTKGDLMHYGIWEGNAYRFKANPGNRYDVTVGDVEGYDNPGAKSILALYGENEADMRYLSQIAIVDTVVIDEDDLDPMTRVSGDIKGAAVMAIKEATNGYMCKNTADGEMTICPLNRDDFSQYSDGTTTGYRASNSQDGTECFIKFPTFWYKGVKKDNKVYISFAYNRYTGSLNEWDKWDENILLSPSCVVDTSSFKYRSFSLALSSNDYYSVVSSAALYNVTNERGNGFDVIQYYQLRMIFLLYIAYYGNTQMKSLKGEGSTTNILNGYYASMDDVGEYGVSSFFGLFGLIEAYITFWVEGIAANATDTSILIEDIDGNKIEYDNIGTSAAPIKHLAHKDGRIEFINGDINDLAGFTTGYCMASYIRRAYMSGYNNGGIQYINGNSRVRISFRGKIVVENDVSKFKSLTEYEH